MTSLNREALQGVFSLVETFGEPRRLGIGTVCFESGVLSCCQLISAVCDFNIQASWVTNFTQNTPFWCVNTTECVW